MVSRSIRECIIVPCRYLLVLLTPIVLCMVLLRSRDWPTIPQLYVDGEFIGGCDIVTQLYGENGEGELKEILTAALAKSE